MKKRGNAKKKKVPADLRGVYISVDVWARAHAHSLASQPASQPCVHAYMNMNNRRAGESGVERERERERERESISLTIGCQHVYMVQPAVEL